MQVFYTLYICEYYCLLIILAKCLELFNKILTQANNTEKKEMQMIQTVYI